jgi:hypothetical protein
MERKTERERERERLTVRNLLTRQLCFQAQVKYKGLSNNLKSQTRADVVMSSSESGGRILFPRKTHFLLRPATESD